MEKRYQVFISSTFEDLKEERQEVLKAVLLQDQMPAGMELFPASDDDAWQLIKGVIDESDYYLLIIAGRYGSRDEAGIGFTEKEYDYAVERKKPVIALLHGDPNNLPRAKTETDEAIWKKLQTFRAKVENSHHCNYWKSPAELKTAVVLGIASAVKTHPAVGWVRADRISSEELLNEINEVRKENEELKRSLSQYKTSTSIIIPDLASLDEKYRVGGTYYPRGMGKTNWSIVLSWREIFALIAPFILNNPNEDHVESVLDDHLFEKSDHYDASSHHLDAQSLQSIKVQFMALGLVAVNYLQTVTKSYAWFWSLTAQGKELMFKERVIRTKTPRKA